MKPLFILFILCVFSASCGKYVECDNAELCVKNIGTDTIWCSWGSSLHDIKLPPGESTCRNVGEINTNPNNGTRKIQPFNSDHGDYMIEVTQCNQVNTIK